MVTTGVTVGLAEWIIFALKLLSFVLVANFFLAFPQCFQNRIISLLKCINILRGPILLFLTKLGEWLGLNLLQSSNARKTKALDISNL